MSNCKSLVALLIVGWVAAAALADGDVHVYTDANFESQIKKHEIALVKFYAPWCGHCKRIAPEFDKASTVLKANNPPVALVKVDCTVETATCGKYGVSGYPTLKIFKAGEMASDYNGPREADGIVKYMRTKAGPSSRLISSAEELDKFLQHSEHSIVGFFASADSSLANEFKKAADALAENYRFAHTTDKQLIAKYKYENKIVIFQPPRLQVKLLPNEKVYEGAAQLASIKTFIQKELHGLVGHRTSGNSEDFKNPLVVVYFNVDYIKDTKGSNYVRNRIIKVAQKFAGQEITFAISAINDFRTELTEYGIEDAQTSSKYILGRGAKGQKHKFTGEYSVENLEQFAKDLLANKLEEYMKSEPVPTSNSDAVQTVVARNFNEIVMDETKDVLIEFYAPWCGHCKTLAPKYEELAEKLKDSKHVVIAKMDATANDVPSQFQVKGFPTIYYAPKNSKQNPKTYDGGREVDDFIKYLAKEASEPLVGFDRSGKPVKKIEL